MFDPTQKIVWSMNIMVSPIAINLKSILWLPTRIILISIITNVIRQYLAAAQQSNLEYCVIF